MIHAAPTFSALVLAGGRSIRMGRDKALLELNGQPMWARQREVLASVSPREIFVSARPEQSWAYATKGFDAVLNDALPDCGPLIGITAGLERAGAGHLAVLAIDLPRLPADWFRHLLASCSAGIGVVGRRGGYFEPLAAIYPAELKWLAWEAIAAGRYSLQKLIAAAIDAGSMRAVEIRPEEEEWFTNWNHLADTGAFAEGEGSGR